MVGCPLFILFVLDLIGDFLRYFVGECDSTESCDTFCCWLYPVRKHTESGSNHGLTCSVSKQEFTGCTFW